MFDKVVAMVLLGASYTLAQDWNSQSVTAQLWQEYTSAQFIKSAWIKSTLTVVKLSYNSSGIPLESSTNSWQQVTGLRSHTRGGGGKALLLSNQTALVHAKNLL